MSPSPDARNARDPLATAVASPRIPAENATATAASPAPLGPPIPGPHPFGLVPTSLAFDEDTRAHLRRQLLVSHGAIGVVAMSVALLDLLGAPLLPDEAGLGRWDVGFPLLVFGQSIAGWVFMRRHPNLNLRHLRMVELTHFFLFTTLAGVARMLTLAHIPADSLDPRYPIALYRLEALLTNYPIVFGIVYYGVMIPNTRGRSLRIAGLIMLIPMLATVVAVIANPSVRPSLATLLPGSIIPWFMAGVVAVFAATRATALRREAFEARREANEVGPYTLGRKLGEGGMGEVFLAEHRLLKRPCAIKFVRAELAADPSTAARFEREVRAVTGLSHVNTVRVYDYGRADDGSFYYVMEYLDGPTLDRLVKDRGSLLPGRVVYLLRQLCGALAEAHAAGMVHRDLKPSNILVATLGGQHDVAKLLDFGLVQDAGSSGDGRLTRTGTVLGTPAYMCPEQAGGDPTDARGDVYSLGAVAFFALTGRPPFEGTTAGKLLTAHLTQQPPNLTEIRADIPADLAAIIARCLAKNPADRYRSAVDLEIALACCESAADWSSLRARLWWTTATSVSNSPDDANITRTNYRQ